LPFAPPGELRQASPRSGEFGEFAFAAMARALPTAIDSTAPQILAFPDSNPDADARELVTLLDLVTRKQLSSPT